MSSSLTVKSALAFLTDLLFPKTCVGCGQEGAWLCSACMSALPAPTPDCPFCRTPTLNGATCTTCGKTHVLNGRIAVTDYKNKMVHGLIWGLKYSAWWSLAEPIGRLVGATGLAMLPAEVRQNGVLVPIPLHPSRLRFRGFNQSRKIAEHAGQVLGLPIAEPVHRIRKTQAQARLGADARHTNVAGAFGLRGNVDFSMKSVILVDDVCTTGATLEAAARLCRANGAQSVWGLVFASG